MRVKVFVNLRLIFYGQKKTEPKNFCPVKRDLSACVENCSSEKTSLLGGKIFSERQNSLNVS